MSNDSARQLVKTFLETAWNARDPEAAGQYLLEDYIGHNPTVPAGRAGFISGVQYVLGLYPETHIELKHIVVEGNLVAAHGHWTRGADDRGYAALDLCRVEDGLIVEHWDVLQEVPEESANSYGMF